MDQVLALDYVGTGDHTCLTDAQRLARHAREQATRGAPPPDSRMEGFVSLLKMVEKGSSLGNDEWIAVHDAIVQQFGRPLARAAASEKLVIGK